MQRADLKRDIDLVNSCGPIQVWSVVVTALGDVLQTEEAVLSGPVLDRLVGAWGINNQALRVALHRLRADGWVVSEKRGRLGVHRLSDTVFARIQSLRPQIFPTPSQTPSDVSLVVGAPGIASFDFEADLPQGAAVIAPRCALVPGEMRSTEALMVSRFAADTLPPWVETALASPVLRAEYDELATAVERVLSHADGVDIWDQTALRLVILHHWRRLRLRHGAVQDLVLPETWEGARARRLVMQAFERFARPDVATLEAARAAR